MSFESTAIDCKSTLIEILFNVSPKDGKILGQKVASIRCWNILPTFGTRFHHVSITKICFTLVWWNLVLNIGRLFHHLMEATFWPCFVPRFGETLKNVSNSVLLKFYKIKKQLFICNAGIFSWIWIEKNKLIFVRKNNFIIINIFFWIKS